MSFRSTDEASGFLAGVIDGEGSVRCKRYPNGIKRNVRITNCDPALIEATVEACRALGVKCSVHSRMGTKLHAWTVHIGGDALAKLDASVTLRSPAKAAALRAAASYQPRVARTPRDAWPMDRVRELRAAGLTGREIGAELGICESTAYRWIREAA